MAAFALDAITSFSYLPLRLATDLGIALTGPGALATLSAILVWQFGGLATSGWSTPILVLTIGGIQLICLGIIGEYLGHIYDEVCDRHLYLVDQKWGFTQSEAHQSNVDESVVRRLFPRVDSPFFPNLL